MRLMKFSLFFLRRKDSNVQKSDEGIILEQKVSCSFCRCSTKQSAESVIWRGPAGGEITEANGSEETFLFLYKTVEHQRARECPVCAVCLLWWSVMRQKETRGLCGAC